MTFIICTIKKYIIPPLAKERQQKFGIKDKKTRKSHK